ncbi:hypothetical protein APHAL10511_005249 [Amanita phalloides]|nr:hypothetical protein APHAL10511_005249 [Amanita phalloides]
MQNDEPKSAMDATPTLVAPHPFDDSDGDLILRTSDKVDFHVHRAILRLSSSVFASMLSFPQPPSQADGLSNNVIDVSDDSKVLYQVLSWIDPRGTLRLGDLDEVAAILTCAEKYDLETVKNRLMEFGYAGRESLKQNPIALFALGQRFRHQDMADFGAKGSLQIAIMDWPDTPLLDRITGRDYQALVHYYLHCQKAAKSVVKDWLQWSSSRDCIWRTPWSLHHCTFRTYEGVNYPEWWIQYLEAIGRALWETPSPHVTSTIDIISVTAPASLCGKCKPKYVADLQSFNDLLVERLDVMLPK